jgi:hypothetical protein
MAAWVHGGLSALHAAGLIYNLRRRQWMDAAIHGAFLIYDTRATFLHARDAHEPVASK